MIGKWDDLVTPGMLGQQEQLRDRTKQSHEHAPGGIVAKIGMVVEEADQAVFWLECLAEAGIVRSKLLPDSQKEANELLATFAASQRTSRS